jgi:methyl coenzyme M reductase gamma subunit
MKSKKEIKKELYKLIDSIDDEYVLNVLNEDIVPYVIENRTKEADEEDDLMEDQVKELDEAIKEADRGETISFEEFKESMDKWRTELKSIKSSK